MLSSHVRSDMKQRGNSHYFIMDTSNNIGDRACVGNKRDKKGNKLGSRTMRATLVGNTSDWLVAASAQRIEVPNYLPSRYLA